MTSTAQQAIRDIIWKHCVGDAEKAANEIAAYLTRLDVPTAGDGEDNNSKK